MKMFPMDISSEIQKSDIFSSKAVKEVGNRLEYTIKGFELFKGEYFTGNYVDGNPEIVSENIDNPEGYPDFLLPNKVYYMQMFTTLAHTGRIPPLRKCPTSL